MAPSIILPPLRDADFDLIWFAVVMTVAMENGPYPSPGGSQHLRVRNIAPDIPLRVVIRGALPFVLLIALAVVMLPRSFNHHLVAQSGDGAAYP